MRLGLDPLLDLGLYRKINLRAVRLVVGSCHTSFPNSPTGSDPHPFHKEWHFIHTSQKKVVLCGTH